MLCDRCKERPARRFAAKTEQWLCPECHDAEYKPAEEDDAAEE